MDMNEEDCEINEEETEMHGTDQSDTQATTQATQNAPRKRKLTSKVWEDFVPLGLGDDGKKRGQCNHCGMKLVTHGTKSLLRHLDNCPKKPNKEDRPPTCLNPSGVTTRSTNRRAPAKQSSERPPTKKATKKQAGTSMDGTSASRFVTESDLEVMKNWIKEQNVILHQNIVKDVRKLLQESGRGTSSSIPSDLDGAEETNQTPQDFNAPLFAEPHPQDSSQTATKCAFIL